MASGVRRIEAVTGKRALTIHLLGTHEELVRLGDKFFGFQLLDGLAQLAGLGHHLPRFFLQINGLHLQRGGSLEEHILEPVHL